MHEMTRLSAFFASHHAASAAAPELLRPLSGTSFLSISICSIFEKAKLICFKSRKKDVIDAVSR